MECMECFPPTIYSIYIYTLVFRFPPEEDHIPYTMVVHFVLQFSTWIRELIHLAGLGHHGFFVQPNPPFPHNQSAYMACLLWAMSCSSLSMFQHLWRNWGEDVCGRDIRLGSLCWHGSPGKQLILRHPEMWHFICCLHLMVLRVLDLYCKEGNVGLSSFFQAYYVFFVCETHCIYSVGDGLKAETRKMSTI